MNTQQLKLLVLSLVLTAMPMTAATAQVTVNLSDRPAISGNTILDTTDHTIALNQFGGIDGQVASIDEASATAIGLSGLDVFFVRNGEVIRQTQTGLQGEFAINGLAEGAYSFFAVGKNGVAAYGVYVTSQPQAAGLNLLEAVTASSNSAIGQLIQRNAPAQVAKSLQSAIQSVNQGSEIKSNNQVRLIKGRLYGQISTLFSQEQSISGVQVQLIQNAETIAQVQTDSNGAFSVPDVEPGVYDYAIGGSNGFAAGRFEAVGNSSPMQQVSYRRVIAQLDACLTCPSGGLIEQPAQYVTGQDTYLEPSYANTIEAPVEYAGESVSYGGASGGTCGAHNSCGSYDGGGIVRGRFGLSGGTGLLSGGGGGGLLSSGGGLGARIGGGGGRLLRGGSGGLGRLLTISSLATGITSIADDDPDEVSGFGN